MENQNSGSFGAAAGGGGSAIAQAMQRRGMDPGVLNQITPSSPTAPQRGLPPAPVGMGSSAPGMGQPQGMGQPPQAAESQIIVKALDSRLKTLGKLQEMGIQV